MYHIYFYENPNGESPVYEWIKKLAGKKGKTARINAGKVNDFRRKLLKLPKESLNKRKGN